MALVAKQVLVNNTATTITTLGRMIGTPDSPLPVTITNMGGANVYLSPTAGVTNTTGVCVPAGQTITFWLRGALPSTIYGIADGTVGIRISVFADA